MGKDKQIQKIRFLDGPGKICNIGRKSFPYNVWKEVSAADLKQIVNTPGLREKFDYDPPVNFCVFTEKEGRKKKKKEAKE